ncbi:MAG: glycosyltransferase [Patescibacteria group bacterium]
MPTFPRILRRLKRRKCALPEPRKQGSNIPNHLYSQYLTRHPRMFSEFRESLVRAYKRRLNTQFQFFLSINSLDDIALCRTLNSLTQQSYPNWKCFIFTELSPIEHEHVIRLIETYNREFPQKLSVSTRPPKEILEEGAFISFISPGDILELTTLEKIVSLNDSQSADIIYTDHDQINVCLEQTNPQFKPDWSPELLLSHNYIGPAVFFSYSLLQTIDIPTQPNKEEFAYDLLLRASEHAKSILHLPQILFHASNKHLQNANAIIQPLREAINRRHLPCDIKLHGDRPVARLIPNASLPIPPVTILIPTKDNIDVLRPCLDSLRKTEYENYEILIIDNGSRGSTLSYLKRHPARVVRIETPEFNFSHIHNACMEHVHTEHIVFLNNDTEVICKDWLTEMMFAMMLDERIGAVGAKLLYPNRSVQHAGVSVRQNGSPIHLHVALDADEGGYAYTNQTLRNVNAVTAACLLTRKSLFENIGGFDEKQFPVTYGDVDFCLRLRQQGFRIVWSPFANLIHREAASRGIYGDFAALERLRQRWHQMIKYDPYISSDLRTKQYLPSL